MADMEVRRLQVEDRRRQELLEVEDKRVEDRKADLEKLEKQRTMDQQMLLKKQQDFLEDQRKKEDKNRMIDRIPKMTSGDDLEAYFIRFEAQMKQAEVPEVEWPTYIRTLLTGTAYTSSLSEEARKNYQLKETLLDIGLSIVNCTDDSGKEAFLGLAGGKVTRAFQTNSDATEQ